MDFQKHYVIQSLAPGSGYSAVCAHESNRNVEIEVRPLDFIAVALVRKFRGGKWRNASTDVVGVELGDGFFEVVTEYENCYGIVRTGATRAECLELLPPSLAARASAPQTQVELDELHAMGDLINV